MIQIRVDLETAFIPNRLKIGVHCICTYTQDHTSAVSLPICRLRYEVTYVLLIIANILSTALLNTLKS